MRPLFRMSPLAKNADQLWTFVLGHRLQTAAGEFEEMKDAPMQCLS